MQRRSFGILTLGLILIALGTASAQDVDPAADSEAPVILPVGSEPERQGFSIAG